MTIAWLAAMAAAHDPQSSVIYPSANAMDQGDGEVGLRGGAVIGPGRMDPRFGLDVGVAATDRLYLQGGLLGIQDEEDGLDAATVSARYGVVQTDVLRIAPFLLGAFATTGDRGTGLLAPGVAIEGGLRRIRGDLAIAPRWIELGDPELPLPDAFAFGALERGFHQVELGVTGLVGDERRHSLRLGSVGFLPVASWRYDGEGFFTELGLQASPTEVRGGAAAGGQVQLGLRI